MLRSQDAEHKSTSDRVLNIEHGPEPYLGNRHDSTGEIQYTCILATDMTVQESTVQVYLGNRHESTGEIQYKCILATDMTVQERYSTSVSWQQT